MVTINKAEQADIPALVDLLAALFSIEVDFAPDRAKQERGLAMLLRDAERAAVFVARVEGRVVGMVSAQLVISTAEGAASAWIEDMVIAEGHRRKGIGKALLAAMLEWAKARGATRAQLLVDQTNAPALAYYDGLGWEGTSLNARRMSL